MALLFPSEEWLKALVDELNNSQEYRDAAKNWEGDFYFIIEPEGSLKERSIAYMDLWHGECRDAFKADDPGQKSPVFELRAPVKTWKGVLSKKIDPIQGLMTRKLKLRGPMVKVMKAPKAAIELVECATKIDTEWPA